jgi:hypothetical protein
MRWADSHLRSLCHQGIFTARMKAAWLVGIGRFTTESVFAFDLNGGNHEGLPCHQVAHI